MEGTHTHARTHNHMHARVHARTHTCAHEHERTNACMHTRTHTNSVSIVQREHYTEPKKKLLVMKVDEEGDGGDVG